MELRQPIVVVIGHVDHGKTKILDKIRGTAIQQGEAGGITQAIGASIIPIRTIREICSGLISDKMKFTIPGLLFIDTPGHAAFSNLRKRGGNIADIAILVVDINEGFKPQTIEAVEILKKYKTPFVLAANKIDLVPGYRLEDKRLLKNISKQDPYTQEEINNKLYVIMGKLSEYGMQSERFDRIEEYTKQIAIVPTSARTGDGIPELLMVLSGLAQKYLEHNLKIQTLGEAKGTVLEVKETIGLGTTLDVIIYDGMLQTGDNIIIGGIEKPVVTKVRAMFEPVPLAEIRDKKSKFNPVGKATAATGVKISASDIDDVIPGMPLQSFNSNNQEEIETKIQKEVEEVIIKTEKTGIIIKADTLGSLEALTFLLKEKDIKVRRATIGRITKKDISDAEANYEKDPIQAVILGFNVEREQDVSSSERVKIITHDIIYKIIEEYEQWKEQQQKLIEARQLDKLIRPCKMQIIPNYVFRQSNPAIVGMDIIEGKIKVGTHVMKEGRTIATVKSIQEEKENLQSVTKGKQVAIALEGCCVGRQVDEGDILYSIIPEEHFRRIKKLTKYLTQGEIEVLKEIAEIMRTINPVWGI
ncbi:translation initiation factor IF-2 [Candidatus Woesearchaeota archaeon]|nr:translation initiation factor IF-2 [Candidatus Woesearchaeota archaeon]